MIAELVREVTAALDPHGFREVPEPGKTVPNAVLLLKRQTVNTNRAVVAVSLPAVPADFGKYLSGLRKQVAFRCRFFPLFWGIGIQVIVLAPKLLETAIDPARHVALADNQWAIVQSLFLLDTTSMHYREGRSWGQVVTGKYQDAIAGVVARSFEPQPM
jgi:hypothetical protein